MCSEHLWVFQPMDRDGSELMSWVYDVTVGSCLWVIFAVLHIYNLLNYRQAVLIFV